ncbi:toxic anion resistance protein [Vibrio sp. S4M6]|uniref:toxic anion resistance protein n=1 Tax=Vibrio sinus TaxID=2946865 RepID=UPI002029E787|nr:toxic anion resistance protein [Vibrio sinus]MCL9783465.1 toxic anion resistance protein [Vibrio sinus]
MIKTFRNENVEQSDRSAHETGNNTVKRRAVKVFDHMSSSQKPNRQTGKVISPIEESSVKHGPSVLFRNKIKSIKSDVLTIDADLKKAIDDICNREYQELQLSNGDYLLISNIHSAIEFYEPTCQIEFGSQLSKQFQDIQGYLSDYAKVGKVDRILDLGRVIIELAKGININIFNPNKLGTKISKLLGNRQQKIRKIKYDFDNISDRIDAKINRVFDNLKETHATLDEFGDWIQKLTDLHHELQMSLVALKLRIEREKQAHNDGVSQSGSSNAFAQTNQDLFERWERKVHILSALNQSISLTFPQVNLYRSNLLTSFERLEEIKVNIIQVWKQQFLTVIAVDESSDATMYYELNDVQEQLIRNIEELK